MSEVIGESISKLKNVNTASSFASALDSVDTGRSNNQLLCPDTDLL